MPPSERENVSQSQAELGPKTAEDQPSDIVLCGRAWADSVRSTLASEGRAACGGWPGTLSEARARVICDSTTTASERERLSRLLYDSARTHWLENRDPLVHEPNHN
jgi:hypothetical protein